MFIAYRTATRTKLSLSTASLSEAMINKELFKNKKHLTLNLNKHNSKIINHLLNTHLEFKIHLN